MISLFYLVSDKSSSPMFYAWTGDKSVAKLFKKQRCMKKFICKKTEYEGILHREYNSYELSKRIMGIRKGLSIIDTEVAMTNSESFKLEYFLDNIDDIITIKLQGETFQRIIKSFDKKYRNIFYSIQDSYQNYGPAFLIDEYYAFSYLFGYTLFENVNELVYDPSTQYVDGELTDLLEEVSLPF